MGMFSNEDSPTSRLVQKNLRERNCGRTLSWKFPNRKMEQHLSVREAKAFTGKSESTIKRLIREIVSDSEHVDRNLILPSPEEVEKRKEAGEPFIWKLNRELLTRRFPQEASGEEGIGASSKASGSANSNTSDLRPIIEVLREQLQSKDRQLLTLETQLDRKDEQIKSLNDRMHESNVLMGELQKRLAIAGPVANKNDPIHTEPIDATTDTKSKASQKPPNSKSNSKIATSNKESKEATPKTHWLFRKLF